ncbi:MAG: acyl-CoA thioesterase [Steroidobacteraceae bacterium]
MRKAGVLPTEIEVDVPFHDVDIAGVVWHGHYAKYIENARWALMHRVGYGLEQMVESGYGWPVVDLELRFLRYARFRDRLRVRASLVEWDSRLVMNYLITDAGTGERVARARSVQVAVAIASGELQFVSPPALVERIVAALEGAP